MQQIVELLTEKNQYLEKFYRLNEGEILSIAQGDFENLENFYQSRDGILNMIFKIDELVEKANAGFDDSVQIEPSQKKSILLALDYKNELVNRILAQDLQILSCIESAKSGIIKELAQVRATKKALGSYKSGAETKTLDEEA